MGLLQKLQSLARNTQQKGRRNYGFDDQGTYRKYMMPPQVDTVTQMVDHIRDNFPIDDLPRIFGLHSSASVKIESDYAQELMMRVYRYQFVIMRPQDRNQSVVHFNKHDQKMYEYYR